MPRSKIICKLNILLFLLLALCTAYGQDRASSAMSGPSGGGGFGSGAAGPIGAGDLVEMSVFDTPELCGKLRVNNTGDIILPLVGAIHVQGLTTLEAQTLIRQKFIDGGFLKDPQVTVFVSEYATQGVSVVGEVRKPVSIRLLVRTVCSTTFRLPRGSRPWRERPSPLRTSDIPISRSILR